MNLLILAAGLGTRLGELTDDSPKCMVEVAGKPVIGHILDRLVTDETEEVVIVIGRYGHDIMTYVNGYYPHAHAEYIVQCPPKGEADAVWQARFKLGGPTLIAFGDTIWEDDFSELQDQDAAVWTRYVYHKQENDYIQDGKDGLARFLFSHDGPGYAIRGGFYFKNILDFLKKIQEYDDFPREVKLREVAQDVIYDGAKMEIRELSYSYDCGTPEGLKETEGFLLT